MKRIDPFGEPIVNVSDDRLRSRLKAELGRSATTTLLVRRESQLILVGNEECKMLVCTSCGSLT